MRMFPFEKPRKHQDRFMDDWREVVEEGGVMIAEVPTGVGKTAASLSVALEKAVEEGMKVIFLTPRHSQHMIVLETVRRINSRGFGIRAADIIGKKWLCNIQGVEMLSTSEFSDYCRILREEEKCEYYNKTYENGKMTNEAIDCMLSLMSASSEEIKRECREVCPYEVAMAIARRADVVIADYFHVFSPVFSSFSPRAGIRLEDSILIVDEAHNLPDRIRSNLSRKITIKSIERALSEAKRYGFFELAEAVEWMRGFIGKEERVLRKEGLIEYVEKEYSYEDIAAELMDAGEEVKRRRKRSYLYSIGSFLEDWKEADDRFAFLMKPGEVILLCLDPSVASKEILESAHASLLMSGTLRPLEMYEDLLGIRAKKASYPSPFPKKNRMDIVLTSITSRYSQRGEGMFEEIAKTLDVLMDSIDGSMAFFFPSYDFLREVLQRIDKKDRVLAEKPEMTKDEKERFYRTFYAGDFVLFGVVGGSFSEGVDYPGNKIKVVGIVGLPLTKPDIETRALIDYYDRKYGAGWNYGYAYPAIIKTLQAAGRSIRSENDRGVIIYMDERFAWRNYCRLLPKGSEVVSRLPIKRIVNFLS